MLGQKSHLNGGNCGCQAYTEDAKPFHHFKDLSPASRLSARSNPQISSGSKRASGWKSYPVMNGAGTTRGGTLFAEVGFNLVTGDGLYSAAFQVVITAAEHRPRSEQFLDIPGHCVLHEVIGPAS